MKWLSMVTELVSRLPLERMLVKPPDTRARMKELHDIIKESETQRTEEPAAPEEPKPLLEPRSPPSPEKKVVLQKSEKASPLTTTETVEYQNREIAKALLVMQKHCSQKFRIKGVPCDCGQGRHLLELEGLCEETIGMVENPGTYYRIIDVGRELEPKCRPDIVATGKYDEEYPVYAGKYRDLRKELMGTEAVEVLLQSGKEAEKVEDNVKESQPVS